MESNFVGGRLPALGGLSQESVRSRWINLALIVVLVGGLSYSGRAAAGTGPQVQLAASQSPLDFGNVSTGTNKTKTITLTNSGSASIRLSRAHVSVQRHLWVNPTSASFGNVGLGTHSAHTITLTNPGPASVTVYRAYASGSGFSMTGLRFPLKLGPGQKTTFSVVFAPVSTRSVTGRVSVVSKALTSPTTIALSGSGVQPLQPQLSVTPPSASFGNVGVGTRNTYAFTLTNSGSASVTVSQANVSGSGLSMGGLSLPLTLTPGQKTTFSVVFAPASTGNITGSVSLVSNALNSPTTVALSGIGVQPLQPQLSVVPPSASFGDVAVGTRNSQTITLINSGTANVTISQATPSGNGFSMTGLTVPLTLSAGQRTSFNAAFAPASAGSVTGSLSLVSDAPNSPSTIALSGAGVTSTFLLTASPTGLSFGNVTVGSKSAPQTVTLTNPGNSSVSISQINVSGSGFSASGLTAPLTLAAGQTASFSVVFASTTAGTATGNVSLVSNATNSPTIALSASGVQPIPLARTLSWNPSPSAAVSYNVYRGTQSGGSYQKLNSSPVSTTTYTDNSVLAGQTYFYVVTAVDSRNVERVHSNEVSATIPSQ